MEIVFIRSQRKPYRAEQLGTYLDILNETVTFDMDSKRPLSKEELNRIDWAGTSAGQHRERWFYMDVYEISSTNPATPLP